MIDTSLNDIQESEYRDRVTRTQEAMRREGFDLLLAWSDCYRMSNVRWLTNYRAFDGVIPYSSLALVPPSGEPTLFVTGGLLSVAKANTWLKDVREIRTDLGPMLREYAASGSLRRVGVGGYRYLAVETWDVIRDALPAPITTEPTLLLDMLKSVKSEAEIRNMKVAGRLADVGCEAIEEAARAGITERELARIAYGAMFREGADGIAFDVFVQIGENSANYYLQRPTDRALRDGDLIMIDMGCRFNGYAADNARGVAFGNVSSEAQRALDVCLEAWEAGMRHIRPGITAGAICAPANEVLIRHGYLPAGKALRCGHGTGMDPEEEYPSLQPESTDVLVENQTLCYAITLLVPGIGGCRVEDPVVVRKDGPESLSNYPYRNHWRAG
jgi:Xaa-Pro aminopeptidase